jgi:hypothetical protein
MIDRVTANLPAKEMNATAAFYRKLGFGVDFQDEGWMILSRGPLEIEFFPDPELDPRSSAFSACVRVGDVDHLYTEWLRADLPSQGIPRLDGPPGMNTWPLRGFALVDLNGSLLRCLEERHDPP